MKGISDGVVFEEHCTSCFLSIQEAAVFNPSLPGAISLSYLQDILADPQGRFSQIR